MSKSEILYSLVLVAGVLISSFSQVLLKKSALKKHDSVIKEYLNPYVITAYFIFICATVLTVIAYRVIPLSLGTLLDSTGYIFITIFGIIFFGERLNTTKALALGLIIAGIVVFSI